jgi:DNA (cytosine-5)-methyltransferase 1
MARPIAVDLFAGAGGMSLGFEQAGFDVLAAVELDW